MPYPTSTPRPRGLPVARGFDRDLTRLLTESRHAWPSVGLTEGFDRGLVRPLTEIWSGSGCGVEVGYGIRGSVGRDDVIFAYS